MGNCLATLKANNEVELQRLDTNNEAELQLLDANNEAELQLLFARAEELGLELQVQIVQDLGVSIEKQILLIQSYMEEKEKTLQEREKTLQEREKTLQEREKTLQEREKTLQEKEKTLQEKEKRSGRYWHTINDIWNEEEGSFAEKYVKFRSLRDHTEFYKIYMEELENGFEVQEIVRMHTGVSFATSANAQDTNQQDAESQPSNNRKSNMSHDSKYNKNITGESSSKSRAHLLPKDKDCNPFWQKAVEVVTGAPRDWGNDNKGIKFIEKLLEIVVQTKANRLTFKHEHNHYFDTMKEGIILVIPLFGSMEEMAAWDYKKKGYKALIVASSNIAYTTCLGFTDDFPHILDATKDDVERGTKLLSNNVELLADSLVSHWDDHFVTFTEQSQQSRKQMLGKMKERLENDKFVKIPSLTKDSSWEPKLIKIDFDKLYKDEAAKHYIPDPFLLLMKAASNWSFKSYHPAKYKLLPACSSVSDSDDSSLSLFLSDVRQVFSKDLELVGQEISIVTDDEQEIDDGASTCSELSGEEE